MQINAFNGAEAVALTAGRQTADSYSVPATVRGEKSVHASLHQGTDRVKHELVKQVTVPKLPISFVFLIFISISSFIF